MLGDHTTSEVCPVTLEEYTPTGATQPLFLPECGHTFSRTAIENIIYVAVRNGAWEDGVGQIAPIRCPICLTPQPHLHIGKCKPNWDTIRRMEQLRTLKAAAAEADNARSRDDETQTPPSEPREPPFPALEALQVPSLTRHYVSSISERTLRCIVDLRGGWRICVGNFHECALRAPTRDACNSEQLCRINA
jgi:hypothetical protein